MLFLVTNYIGTLLSKFRSDEDEEGQTLVEYGLLLALIAIIVIIALLFLGPIVSRIFQNVGSNLNNTGS
jgi:pilus assembly protein Flp/PilA